jgi:hypothetical protein
MAIPIKCPGCQAAFDVPDTLADKTIRCTSCKTQLTVPTPAVPAGASGEKKPGFGSATAAPPVAKPAAPVARPATAAPARPAVAAKPAAPVARPAKPAREEDDEDDDKARPTKSKAANGKPAKAAARRRDDDDDDEDEDDRPRRGRKAAKGGSPTGMLLLIGGGVLGLCAAVGVAVFLLMGSGDDKKETAKNDSTPAGTTPSSAGAPPSGGSAQPPSAMRPPTGGSSRYNPSAPPPGVMAPPAGMGPPGGMEVPVATAAGDWQAVQGNGFSCEMPGKPDPNAQIPGTGGLPPGSKTYFLKMGADEGLFVVAVTIPGVAGNLPADQARAVLNKISTDIRSQAGGFGGFGKSNAVAVGATTDFTQDGQPGVEATLTEKRGGSGGGVIRFVLAGNKLVMYGGVSDKYAAFQPTVQRFVGSMKFNAGAVAMAPPGMSPPGIGGPPGYTGSARPPMGYPGVMSPPTGAGGPPPAAGGPPPPGMTGFGGPPPGVGGPPRPGMTGFGGPPTGAGGPPPGAGGPPPGVMAPPTGIGGPPPTFGGPRPLFPGASGNTPGYPGGPGGTQGELAPPPGAETQPPRHQKVEQFLTVAFDTEHGDLFTVSPRQNGSRMGGTLTRYSYPDFKKKTGGQFNIPNCATRAVIDPKKNLLYLAAATSATPATVARLNNNLFDRPNATGAIEVYDLAQIRDGKAEPNKNGDLEAKPVATIPAGFGSNEIVGLEIAPDGQALYVLTSRTVSGRAKSTLKLINPADKKVVKEKDLDHAWAMRAAPDGKTLYVIEFPKARGNPPVFEKVSVTAFDTESWSVARTLPMPAPTTDVAPTTDGHLMAAAAEGAAPTKAKLFLFDPNGDSREVGGGYGEWKASHNNYAAFSANAKYLFVTSLNNTTPGRGTLQHAGLDVYKVTSLDSPTGLKKVSSIRRSGGTPIGGFFHVSPDGDYLMFQTGAVLAVDKLTENVGGPDPAVGGDPGGGVPGMGGGFPGNGVPGMVPPGGAFPTMPPGGSVGGPPTMRPPGGGGFPGMPPGGGGVPPIGTPPSAVPPIGTPPTMPPAVVP